MGNLLKSCAIALASLLTTSPSVSGQTDEKHLIIPGKGIGPVKIGMSVDAVKSVLGPGEIIDFKLPRWIPFMSSGEVPVGLWPIAGSYGRFFVFFGACSPTAATLCLFERMDAKVYTVWKGPQGLIIGIDDDPSYTTASGVHIGSTLEEVRSAFSEPTNIEHAITPRSGYPVNDEFIEFLGRGITLLIRQDRVVRISVCATSTCPITHQFIISGL